MADSKDYIVNYEINVNAGNAVTGLTSLKDAIDAFGKPMETIKQQVSDIMTAVNSLNKIDDMKLKPQLDVKKFNEDLDKLEQSATATANKIKLILRGAITGESSSSGKKQKSASKSDAALNAKTVGILEKAFNDDGNKDFTVTLNGDASDTFSTIENIKKKLDELSSSAKFTIDPMLNLDGFAKAEQKLKALAQLSNAVVAPFAPNNSVEKKESHKKLTGDEKRQLKEAKENLDALNEQKKQIESRLDRNTLKYSKSPNNSLKGWVTRDTKALDELKQKEAEYQSTISKLSAEPQKQVMSAVDKTRQMFIDITGNISKFEITGKIPVVPVEAKFSTDGIVNAIKSIPVQTVDVALRVNTIGAKEQIAALTGGAVSENNIESELKKKLEYRRTDDDYKKWLTDDEKKQYDQASLDYNDYKQKINEIRDRYYKNIEKNNVKPSKSLAKKINADKELLDSMALNNTSFDRKIKLQNKAYQNEKAFVEKELKSSQKAGSSLVIDVIGRFAGFVEQSAPTIPANVKFNPTQVAEAFKAIPAPTIQANVKLNIDDLKGRLERLVGEQVVSDKEKPAQPLENELYKGLKHKRNASDYKKWLDESKQDVYEQTDSQHRLQTRQLDTLKDKYNQSVEDYNKAPNAYRKAVVNRNLRNIKQHEENMASTKKKLNQLKLESYNNEKEFLKNEINSNRAGEQTLSSGLPSIVIDVKGRFTGLIDGTIEPISVAVKISNAQVAEALKSIPEQFININARFSQAQVTDAFKGIQVPAIDISARLNMDGISEQIKQISGMKSAMEDKSKNKKLTAKQIDEEVEKITPYKRTYEHTRQWLYGDDLKRFDEIVSQKETLEKQEKKFKDSVKKKMQEFKERKGKLDTPNYSENIERFKDAYASTHVIVPDRRSTIHEYLRLRDLSIENEKKFVRESLTKASLDETIKQSSFNGVIELNAKLNTGGISKQINEMPRLTIPLAIKLMWSGGAVGRQQQIKSITEKIKPITIQVSTSAAVEAFEKFVRFVKANDSFNISLNISTAGIVKQINEMKRPSMPVAIKLMWSGGAVGRQAQLKEISNKIPPIVIKLDTTNAVHSLEEFVSLIKSKSPQKIQIVSDTVMQQEPARKVFGETQSTMQQAVRTPESVKSLIFQEGVVTDNEAVNKYNEQKEKARKLDAKKRTDGRFMVQKANEYNEKEDRWRDYQQSLYDRLFGIPKTGDEWVTKAQERRADELRSMAEDAEKVFSKLTPFEQSIDDARRKSVEESIAKHKKTAESLRTKAFNAMLPFAETNEQANMMVDNRKSIAKAMSMSGAHPGSFGNYSATKKLGVLQNIRGLMEAKNTKVPLALQNQIKKFEKEIEQQRFAQLQQESANSISRHQKQADMLRTKALNSVLPFVDSKEQAKIMVENRKFFKDAMSLNGIEPGDYASSDAGKKLDVLRDARTLMETRNSSVPMPLQNQIKKLEKEIEQQKFAQRQQESTNSIARHQKQADMLRAKAYNAFAPFAENKEQLKMLVENRKFFKKVIDESGLQMPRGGLSTWINDNQKYQHLKGMEDLMIHSGKAVPWQFHDQVKKLKEQINKKNSANYAKLKAQRSSESIYRHAKQAQKLRAEAYNAMLPFAENKEQVKTLVKYRKFFKKAMAESGIDVTPDMDNYNKLKYLQDVSGRMKAAKVEVPWQLQNQMKKISKQLDKEEAIRMRGTGGGGGSSAYEKTFFDKSRKWAFPFTGPTSFGSNTPMAVEMAKGMGAAYAIEGAMSVIGGSFGQAVDYQNIMKTTQAILQNGTDSYSNNAFNTMEKTVRNVGIKTKFSAPEVADAAKFLAMAGYDINAINNAIRPIADLALIGDSDLGETADKMTNIMTTFQIAPEKMREAANIMATTAMRSNTDLMMLAESAKYGGGVANLYGRNDPNLFADTMALFGVMGNAGIQASSAGTALRMMYQNIFNPNKKQQALLEQIKKDYGITTLDEDGGYRAMSDILIDIAEKVPENKMADIVGKLFRITAQPGANAALLAAANGDENLANANAKKIDEITDKMSTKAGISSLVSLMKANRDSANGNISGIIADEKQNTIHGLWAQVTSTFTEAILRAFEARKDEFESMLRGLRDYFAKPETLRTIQVFMDAIVDIGKTMASFAQVWAKIYTMAPNLISFWIKTQLFFTQVGALMSPFVSLIGALSKIKELLIGIAGMSNVHAVGNVSKYASAVLATKEKFGTPLVIPGGMGKKPVKVTGGAALRAQQEMKSNAELAAELALSGADMKEVLESLNSETNEHYAEVRRRANRRYGFARAGRAFSNARKMQTIPVLVAALAGLKTMLVSVATAVLSAFGALLSPLGLVGLAVAGVAGTFYWAYNKINGTFEDQIVLTQKISDKFAETTELALKKTQWYQDELDKMKQKPTSFTTPEKSQQQKDYEERVSKFRGEFGDIPNLMADIDSKPQMIKAVSQYREKIKGDPLAKFSLGSEYENLVGDKLFDEKQTWWNLFSAKGYVNPVVNKVARASLYMAAKDDKALPSIHAEFMKLYEKYGYTQKFMEEAGKIRDAIADKNNPIWESANGLSIEQFNNIDDPTRFKEYHEGLWNILDAMINGVTGTVIGKKNAYETLKNGVPQYTPEWFGAIENIIGDVSVLFSTMNEKGKPFTNIPIKLRMDNGVLDSQYIFEQLQSNIDGYQSNVRDLVQIFIMAYKQLAELGGNEDTPLGALEFLKRQMEGYQVSKEDAKYMYHNFMPDWVRDNNISLQRYQNMMAGDFGWIKVGNTEYNRANEVPNMLNQIFDKMVRDYYILPKSKQATEKLHELGVPYRPDLSPIEVKKIQNPNPTNTGNDDGKGKNDPYKNHYSSQSARPTHITFNINELVHFDRTTVAANANEKELMESMESKITEVVYKIFAEAANQAHTLIGAQ